MTDDKPDFVCDECGVVLSSIYDFVVHAEVLPEVLLQLGRNVSLNLWSVLEETYFLIDEGKTQEAKDILQSVGVTLYSLKTGLLHEQLDELIVESSIENLDEKLKELLDEQTNND